MDKNFDEIVTKSLKAFIIRISGLILSFFLIFLISRSYGAAALGVFSLSLTLLQVFSILGKSGLDVASMKYISEFSSQNRWGAISKLSVMVMKIVLPVSVTLSVIIYIFSPQMAELIFNKIYLAKYFKIISLGIVPNILLIVFSEKLRGLKEITKYSVVRNTAIPLYASLFLGLSLIFIKDDSLPVLSYLCSLFLTSILSICLWRNAVAKKRGNAPEAEVPLAGKELSYKALLKFSIPMLLTNSLVLLMGWTDTIMLGMFRTTFEVGIYRVPLRLAAITSISLVAVNSILGPKIAALWKQKKVNELKKVVRQSTVLIFWSTLGLSLPLIVFRLPVLRIFGGDFSAGSLAIIFLVGGQLVSSVVGSTGLILIMTGRHYTLQYVVLLGTILNITANYVLIPKYGINGAAFSSLLSMLFINIIPFVLIKKYYGFYTLSRKVFFLK